VIAPDVIAVDCRCGGVHAAWHSHEGAYGEGPIYAATCPLDGLADYFTLEAAR
jgi:hypothetical protein